MGCLLFNQCVFAMKFRLHLRVQLLSQCRLVVPALHELWAERKRQACYPPCRTVWLVVACAMTASVCTCTALAAVPAGLVTATLGGYCIPNVRFTIV